MLAAIKGENMMYYNIISHGSLFRLRGGVDYMWLIFTCGNVLAHYVGR